MLYFGFAFVAVAIAAFVVGFWAGVPGLALATNVALFLGLVFLAFGLVTGHGSRHAYHRHAHR